MSACKGQSQCARSRTIPATRTVNTIATMRRFHQTRRSVTSYAAFSPLISASIPDDAVHNAAASPSDSLLPTRADGYLINGGAHEFIRRCWHRAMQVPEQVVIELRLTCKYNA